jgi:hypothetical protein
MSSNTPTQNDLIRSAEQVRTDIDRQMYARMSDDLITGLAKEQIRLFRWQRDHRGIWSVSKAVDESQEWMDLRLEQLKESVSSEFMRLLMNEPEYDQGGAAFQSGTM